MNKTEITLEYGKKIEIYDDILPMKIRVDLYLLAKDAQYKIGWHDSDQPEHRAVDNPLHSEMPLFVLNTIGFLDYTKELLEGYELADKATINLTLPSNTHFVHTHDYSKILLYYVNLDWNEGYMGETLFYSENKKSIQYASPYVPGRIIVFDGSIPHTIRPQSFMAPMHRFTLAVKLK